MRLIVKTLNGKEFFIDVDPTDSVFMIKRKIEKQEGVPVDLQKILFGGESLPDDATVKSYNLQKDYTLDLLVKLEG